MSYEFDFEVGDWSGDGHGNCDKYHFKSNVSVEEIREVWFGIDQSKRIQFESMFSEYEDCLVHIDTLRDLGLEHFAEHMGVEEESSVYALYDTSVYADMWASFIEQEAPGISLERIPNEFPRFHFWGMDDQNRHIEFLGYGLFHV